MKKPLDNLHWTERTTLLFLFKHMMAGAFGGILFGVLLLYFNVNGLWSLISTSQDAMIAITMMFMGLILTFGSMGMGLGVFSLGQETDDHPSDHYY